MFTGKPQKNRGAATTYFDEHLSHNDYSSQAETQAGHWIAVAVERLGIKQGEVVTREAFLRLCDNLHPTTGKQLTKVTAKDGRIFFDFQCAPPKSVPILAIAMNWPADSTGWVTRCAGPGRLSRSRVSHPSSLNSSRSGPRNGTPPWPKRKSASVASSPKMKSRTSSIRPGPKS